MIHSVNIQIQEHADTMRTLQVVSYAVEAQLIGFDGIPPLHETVEELQACGEHFWVYELDGSWVGAIAYEAEGKVVGISRLVVHPDYFRRGIARALLRHVLHEVMPNAMCYQVSTGAKNEPALRLYRSEGFHEIGQQEVAPDVWITCLEMRKDWI